MGDNADEGMTVVTHRVPRRLAEDMKQAAEQAGMTRSQWMREVADLAIQWDWMARHREVLVHTTGPTSRGPQRINGGRRLGMNVYMPADRCLHPPTAREVLPTSVRCTLCGQTLRPL